MLDTILALCDQNVRTSLQNGDFGAILYKVMGHVFIKTPISLKKN